MASQAELAVAAIAALVTTRRPSKVIQSSRARASNLDSSGVALLLRLAERLQTRRRQLHLVVPRGSPVRRVLVFTGLPRVIPVEARLEDALAARCDSGLPDDLA
jgi:anti-anti-sigma factor